MLLGNPPELLPIDPDTGYPTPAAELTEDTRVVVDTVLFDEKPEGNPWLAPNDPSWGAMQLGGKRKKGGTYSFVMEEI